MKAKNDTYIGVFAWIGKMGSPSASGSLVAKTGNSEKLKLKNYKTKKLKL